MPAKKSVAKTKKTTSKSKDTAESFSENIKDSKKSSEVAPSRKNTLLSKKITWIALGLGVIVLIAALANKYFVVAWVDNKPITRVELINSLQNRYGKDMTEELIVENLLLSEAAKRKIAISTDDINKEIKNLEDKNGGSDKFNQMLTTNGLTRNDLSKLLRIQLIREKMFSNGTEVSDKELQEYIDQNKEQLPEVTEEVKTSLKDQLKQQKMATNFNNWLSENLKSARVKRI